MAAPQNSKTPTQCLRRQQHESHQSDNTVANDTGNSKDTDRAETLQNLLRSGWSRSPNIVHNSAICEGRVIVNIVRIAESLFFRGNIIVVEELTCDGLFAFGGTLDLWSEPATFKHLVVYDNDSNTINGDVVVTSSASILGNCHINGTLTVTGTLTVSKTVTCNTLKLTGILIGHSDAARIETFRYRRNGHNHAGDEIVYLQEYVDTE